jgi:phage regulatory protein, rha family
MINTLYHFSCGNSSRKENDIMAKLEQTLDSTEIADMIEKSHSNLIRDIRRYTEQFNEGKISYVDFFKESTYIDAKGQTRPCYRITKKGCEFIAHKLTGTKGTVFTARYINRFHEMENTLSDQTAIQTQENRELSELREAVRQQGKLLEKINRNLVTGRITEMGSRTEQEMYRVEIIKMVNVMDSKEALCKIYTFAKYVPK